MRALALSVILTPHLPSHPSTHQPPRPGARRERTDRTTSNARGHQGGCAPVLPARRARRRHDAARAHVGRARKARAAGDRRRRRHCRHRAPRALRRKFLRGLLQRGADPLRHATPRVPEMRPGQVECCRMHGSGGGTINYRFELPVGLQLYHTPIYFHTVPPPLRRPPRETLCVILHGVHAAGGCPFFNHQCTLY